MHWIYCIGCTGFTGFTGLGCPGFIGTEQLRRTEGITVALISATNQFGQSFSACFMMSCVNQHVLCQQPNKMQQLCLASKLE
jgi:hypothetical protein